MIKFLNFHYLCSVITERWPSWSKAHAWKVCKLQKGFMGSNPILSAGIFIKC